MRATWLITGASGLLGSHVVRAAARAGHDVVAVHRDHAAVSCDGQVRWRRVDLEDETAVRELVRATRPAVIINAAAMPVPAECERHPERARRINIACPAALADEARACGARLVHVSTDLVFDGEHGPYSEGDAATPISHYGRTKAQSELEVAERCRDHVVVRISLLLGPSPGGARGVDEALHAALLAGERVRLFTDEFRNPAAAADVARVLLELGAHPYRGVLHVGGPQVLSRHALGLAIARTFGDDVGLISAASVRDARDPVPPRAPDTSLRLDRLAALHPALTMPGPIEEALVTARSTLTQRLRP